MWEKMTHEIRKVAKETLGESRGFGPRGKEFRWSNKSVQSKVRIKRNVLQSSLCVKVLEFGKIIRPKKETTKALNEAKSQVFYGLYLSLGTNER